MTQYTDPGKVDFDTVMQLLNPYGTWSKINGVWAYTPLDHVAPYTHGRWIYTEFGWCWKGDQPHSWVTEHYGYWKRSADHVWSWFPGPYWLPEIVEIRATPTHIGWRSAAVDQDGNFIEDPATRYTKTDEWTFVTLAQFTGPITPNLVAKPDVVRDQLDESTDSHHTYITYREIDRPGPHPADFLALSKNGGMFAPRTVQDELAAQPTPQFVPGVVDPTQTGPMRAPNPDAKPPAVDPQAALNARKVNYWITMSLPSFWTPRPADAQPKEIYFYRPDFYQDDDGIARRITLWLDPKSRTTTGQTLTEILSGNHSAAKADPNSTSTLPGTPAVPVDGSSTPKPHNAFRSPFDDSFHVSAASTSSKAPAPSATTNAPDAPVPPPIVNTPTSK
jgi:hypothetical protein